MVGQLDKRARGARLPVRDGEDERLGDATIFTTLEPCAMCVGALLESNVETLVFALPNPIDGAAGSVIQLAQHAELPRRIRVISGIRRDEAEELRAESTSIA